MNNAYDDNQRHAIAVAINGERRGAEEVAEAAGAGTLGGLEPFDILPGHVLRIAAEEHRRWVVDATAAAAERNPCGVDAITLAFWDHFAQELQAFRDRAANGAASPREYEQFAKALDRAVALKDRVEALLGAP